MNLLIRTVFNNKGWSAPCDYPFKDGNCIWCLKKSNLGIKVPSSNDAVCSGDCWERKLCVAYRWGCTPQGKRFRKVHPGMEVYLVYKQPDGNYILWGQTKIKEVNHKFEKDFGKDYQFIYFEPFKPLPQDKWVRDLTDVCLVGKKWRQGRFRYIDSSFEDKLRQLLVNNKPQALPEFGNRGIDINEKTCHVQCLAPQVRKQLENFASKEGRETQEIIREAIAEWLKGRI